METSIGTFTHEAFIKPDKCLLSWYRNLYFGEKETPNGHIFTDRHVFYYPEDLFYEDMFGEKIFWIQVLPKEKKLDDCKKFAIPLFMLGLTRKQKVELINLALKNKWELGIQYFCKPISIVITYPEERLIEDDEEVVEVVDLKD